jgi:signal transduction histidine kinase
MHDELLFNHVLSTLDFVVLERLPDGPFRPLGHPPNWFTDFCHVRGADPARTVPETLFPFLESYFPDAERIWAGHSLGLDRSGIWVEVNESGEEIPLCAWALCSERRELLVIRLLGSDYESDQNKLQKGREKNLDFHRLQRAEALLRETNRELQEMHQELALKNRHLAELVEEKNRLLGMAAHDLRNPLAGIKGFSELLLDDTGHTFDPDQLECLSIIRSASEDMLSLVNNLLDISKIESGRLDLNLEPTNFSDFIERMVKLNQVISQRKNIKIEFIPIHDFPTMRLDKSKIGQVFNNLLTNAVKFSHEGNKVWVILHKVAENAMVSVQDEGQGIPAAEIEKLFKPFSKTSVLPTKGEESTGLGLAISKKIIEAHRGNIHAESTVGKGSVFIFQIPIS